MTDLQLVLHPSQFSLQNLLLLLHIDLVQPDDGLGLEILITGTITVSDFPQSLSLTTS